MRRLIHVNIGAERVQTFYFLAADELFTVQFYSIARN